MLGLLVILSILVISFFVIDDTFADKAAGKPIWQYGSATEDIVCGDKLCSEVEQVSVPVYVGVDAPLKQVAQGIEPESIVCTEGLFLMIKYDGSPACVKQTTVLKLFERSWGKLPETAYINSFEFCVAAGNPVMESYPRQCRSVHGNHFVETLSEKEECEMVGGLWGIWGNMVGQAATCNPATSDAGLECTDSSQCKSFCQANEGAQIGSEESGECYGYELAICMQEVRNGMVDAEWCQ